MFLRTLEGQRPSTPRDERAATLPGPTARVRTRPRGHITHTYSQGSSNHARGRDQGAAGGRRPLRPPDAPLEPEDAPLHPRRARRHLHHRPAADRARCCEQAQEFASRARPAAAASCCSSAPRSRPATPSRTSPRRAGMPYVNHRWLGGLLTNFQTINQRIKRLHDLERYETEGQLELLPTRERMAARGRPREAARQPRRRQAHAAHARRDVRHRPQDRGDRRPRGPAPAHPDHRPGRHQLRPRRHRLRRSPATTTRSARARSSPHAIGDVVARRAPAPSPPEARRGGGARPPRGRGARAPRGRGAGAPRGRGRRPPPRGRRRRPRRPRAAGRPPRRRRRRRPPRRRRRGRAGRRGAGRRGRAAPRRRPEPPAEAPAAEPAAERRAAAPPPRPPAEPEPAAEARADDAGRRAGARDRAATAENATQEQTRMSTTHQISAKDVKALREQTGAGMMDCKTRPRGGRRRHRQGRRDPPRQDGQQARQARRPRGHRGHRPVLHPRQRQGRRARRGRLQHRLRRHATTTSSRSPGTIALHIAASPQTRYVSEDEVPAGGQATPRRASSSSRPPTSPRTSARRSSRAS